MMIDLALRNYDLRVLHDEVQHAEALGYDCLWTSETQHDPFLPLAVASTATSSMKLGTSIAVAFARSPMITAYTAWDLQRVSRGRLILGLGSQVKAHNERRFSVKFEAPGPKLREVVLALHAIWECWQQGTKLNFVGRFYRFDLMTPFFNPGPIAHPDIPVFIAGVNHYMCRLAGEVCEGIHVHPFHTPRFLREHIQPAVEEGLQQSNRSRREFTYAGAVFVVVGDTEHERTQNEQAVRQQIAFYASTRTYEPVLRSHGWEGITKELHRKSVEGDWQGMAHLITDEMMDAIAVTGSYGSIGQKLSDRYEGLLDRLMLYQPYDTTVDESQIAAMVRQVKDRPSNRSV
jgi:probable F420-dependent oxidoreductase